MKPSRMSSAAPRVIAESATLNAGQCHAPACRSTKSTTWPKRKRSITLPSAPPRIEASPAQNIRRPGERTSSTETMSAAPRAKAISSGVCQPGASARMLNAAPLLNTSTRLRNSVSSRRSPGAKRASASHLLSWSTMTMAAEAANQGSALDMCPHLARPAQVGSAAGAKSFVVHIRRVVPATLAFGLLARLHGDLRLLRRMDPRGRGEHQELELFAQARQERVVAGAGIEVDLRLQRRAHLAFRPQRLDALAHRIAQLAQTLPLLHER